MPDWRHAIRRRLDGLHLPPTREAELVEELSQHLEDRYNELRSGGATDEVATRDALSELDEADLVRELAGVERQDVREPLALGGAGRGRLAGGLWHDVRFGARLLAKEKGVTLVIVVTLALAIAANTIVFGLTDLLLLKPLPVGNAARLAQIFAVDQHRGNSRDALSVPQYLDVARQATSFDGVTAMTAKQLSLTGSGEPMAVGALMVTANLFRTLGLDAFAGRTFLAGEDAPGRSNVVVLSHRFWTAHFNADRALIGRTLTLNGAGYTVVGVLTPAIEIGTLSDVNVWLPLETASAVNRLSERDVEVFGLLRPGVTVEQANAELATIAGRLQRAYPVTDGRLQLRALSLRDSNVSANTPILLGLLAIVVGLVLLLACANVATVMLARATARRKEMAVRLALGATRARLVRQLISEGLLLGLLAGVVGVLLADAGLAGSRIISPEPYLQLLRINVNVLMFAFVLSVATPVLFGVLPALRLSKPDLTEDLKQGARDGGPSTQANRSRTTLVVAQVAFALTALVVAGLVVRSVIGMQRIRFGVVTDRVLCLRVRFDPPKYVDDGARVRVVDSLLTRLAAVPGVVATGAMSRLPVLEIEPLRQFTVVGRPSPAADDVPWAVEATMAGGYRDTFQLPLLEGRLWTKDDRSTSAPVALVSREAARRYWPNQSPVGQRIVMFEGKDAPVGDSITIVGVVDDVKARPLTKPAPPRLYRPLAQRPAESVSFALRVEADPSALVPTVREALRAEDRDLAVSDIQRFDALIRTQLRTYDLVIALFAGFAGIGLVLAVTGVYGVTAFSVGQRRHEIGVRLALGATAGEVIRLVVARSFKPIAIGIGLGALGGWGVGRTMRSVLFETSALDPSTYVTVIALLAIGGLVASFVPAHRAGSIDPMSVLKRE